MPYALGENTNYVSPVVKSKTDKDILVQYKWDDNTLLSLPCLLAVASKHTNTLV